MFVRVPILSLERTSKMLVVIRTLVMSRKWPSSHLLGLILKVIMNLILERMSYSFFETLIDFEFTLVSYYILCDVLSKQNYLMWNAQISPNSFWTSALEYFLFLRLEYLFEVVNKFILFTQRLLKRTFQEIRWFFDMLADVIVVSVEQMLPFEQMLPRENKCVEAVTENFLTDIRQIFYWCRNKSTELHCKSIESVLYRVTSALLLWVKTESCSKLRWKFVSRKVYLN